MGAVDPGRRQNVVVGDVADHVQLVDARQPGGVTIHCDDRQAGAPQVLPAGGSDPAPSAHDDVPARPADRAVHALPPQVGTEVALDETLQHRAEGVERGSDPDEDQGDGEDLAGRAEWSDLAKTDRRHRGDRLVDGVENTEAEHHVAGGADRQDDGERRHRIPDPG